MPLSTLILCAALAGPVTREALPPGRASGLPPRSACRRAADVPGWSLGNAGLPRWASTSGRAGRYPPGLPPGRAPGRSLGKRCRASGLADVPGFRACRRADVPGLPTCRRAGLPGRAPTCRASGPGRAPTCRASGPGRAPGFRAGPCAGPVTREALPPGRLPPGFPSITRLYRPCQGCRVAPIRAILRPHCLERL